MQTILSFCKENNIQIFDHDLQEALSYAKQKELDPKIIHEMEQLLAKNHANKK